LESTVFLPGIGIEMPEIPMNPSIGPVILLDIKVETGMEKCTEELQVHII